MSFTLVYDLEGVGWADAVVGNGTASVTIPISYLHDTLGELGEIANQVRHGANKGLVRFMDEPGEHQLVLIRSDRGLSFEVRWYEHWQDRPGQDTSYTSILTGHTTAEEFVRAVRNQLIALHHEYGLGGYKEKWERHEFPEQALRDLQSAL